ncbi:cob(I)yrinic acid a,c-diamide adenosyltransferase [Granulicatella sp. zg-ZJ]|uniref:cob(I)yrinic acid a,c-diamide adenosyltransferase n=1 Tax=unclassified Granulicatella TaxID=2630493 RepID=UPI0013C12D3B|nr:MULTISPECIES: cob(I)yrinic acid a,c-diamide adenosyltransferase [unclassified Granulicatella]MBS4750704.1 cob(I)yrinic acid a,c-diamide adenosyltransferase [Carnobacteriaceae bacterium zg-ZUI78]NEW61877.1 cob(I)yrinic acid a,c-diamide adenosyltransferase [Granulicatella sp. zg-ZJ]NEW65951.1 cob(I)yrinic acid a,c-diamide adenosyltransferase [Granulicatella sp. zg-84]QMI85176.1 cob(I)yrinic acid a,c-diamide adenosyltransferase [Carnobacteriaceae bacterium zg-84]
MQLYTKTGDKGLTKLVGGQSAAKDSDRVCAYGTIDELNSWIGYTISQMENGDPLIDELRQLQHYLFDCGSDLSTPHGVYPYKVDKKLVDWIEERIDTYADIPPALETFILQGGDPIASMIHVARTIARRAERHIVATMWTNEINNEVMVFVNRLSDYFFALARVINFRKGVADVAYERSAKVFHNNITKADVERWAKQREGK